jgi:hypothetical protein
LRPQKLFSAAGLLLNSIVHFTLNFSTDDLMKKKKDENKD